MNYLDFSNELPGLSLFFDIAVLTKETLSLISDFKIWLKFTRPYTLAGTCLALCTIYVMACAEADIAYPGILALALLTGCGCNLFIVGINQIRDVEIDRINKPYLPLASGEMSIRSAWIISLSGMILSLLIALFISLKLLLIISLTHLIGWAYSFPPLELRKHHLPAAVCIAGVRGILLNLGAFMAVSELIYSRTVYSMELFLLVGISCLFTIAIAWFKDIPDTEGDSRIGSRSLAIIYSPDFALKAGIILANFTFSAAIIIGILFMNYGYPIHAPVLYGNLILFITFNLLRHKGKKEKAKNFQHFYRRFWYFFFAEYLLFFLSNLS